MVSLDPRNWLKKHEDHEAKEFARVVAHSTLAKPTEQTEFEKALAARIQLIRDEDIQNIENVDCYNYEVEKQADGTYKTVPKQSDYNGQAIRYLNSPIMSLGVIPSSEVKTELLLTEQIVRSEEIEYDETQYNLGIGNRHDAQFMHVRRRTFDSVEGRKAQMFVETKHITQVEAKVT